MDRLTLQLTPFQLAEWAVYFEMEPFGETRADWRAGMLASVMANIHRARHQPAYQPADFLPRMEEEAAIPEAEIERRITQFMNRYH